MPETIVHEYQAKNPTEQWTLDNLARVRCKVVLRRNESQPHMSGINVIFFRTQEVSRAVLTILDQKGEPIDIIELTKPMQELELWSLAEIWEVDAPHVRPTLSKNDAIRELESHGCRASGNMWNAFLSIYNTNSDKEVIITLKGSKIITMPPGDFQEKIVATDIVSVESRYC